MRKNDRGGGRTPRRRTLAPAAALAAAALGTALALAPSVASAASPTTYYVDCSAGTDGSGTQASPWNSLATASAHPYGPGDSILLKSGTTCTGAFTPQGSGTADAYITLSSYGSGTMPIIDGGTGTANPSAVAIRDESYWAVRNLEIKGGYWRGLWIEADTPDTTFTGFKLSNLKVHDQGNRPRVGDWISSTGSVIVEPCQATSKIDDVTVYGVHAYNSHEVGFQFGHSEKAVYNASKAGGYNTPDCHMGLTGDALPPKDGVSDVTIEDSASGYNDESGIWGSGVTNLTIQDNQLHDNGDGQTASGDPSLLNGEGAWWSNSYNVVATGNTSYNNKRGGGDGGGFDADTGSVKSLIENNTIHDNQAYCVAVFGGRDLTTSDVTIDHNTCENNGQSVNAEYEGDIYTWTAGRTGEDSSTPPNPVTPSTIQNLTVHDNIIDRQLPGPAFYSAADYLPGEVSFYNNTITHYDGSKLVEIEQCKSEWPCGPTQPKLNYNSYEVTGPETPTFIDAPYAGPNDPPQPVITGWTAYQQQTGLDANSTFTQP